MKTLKTIVITMAFLLSVFTAPAFAEISKSDQVTNVLFSYLDAAKQGNVEEMIANVKDTRYLSEGSMKADYEKALKENSQQLIKFKVLNKSQISPTVYEYTTKLDFKDRSSYQVPFTLISENEIWKVHISETSLENNYIELLSASINEENRNIYTQANIISWNFWDRISGSTFYSINSFDIDKSSIKLSLTQENQRLNGPGPKITYSVVKYRWYGDDVWGSTSVDGNYTNRIEKTISGKNSSFTGAQIRFKIDPTVNTEYFKGEGQSS